MRRHAFLYLLLFPLLLVSCRSRERALFFCDPVSWEIYSRRGLSEQSLERIAGEQGRRLLIRRALPGAQSEAELNTLLQEREVERVLITPLFTFDIGLTAARFPAVLFIREEYAQAGQGNGAEAGGAARTGPANNLVRISYDREAAFRRAGEAAAALLPDLGPAEGGAGQQARVGILAVPLSERGTREIAAFREGFAGREEEGLLVERQVSPASDRVRARHALEEMRQAGVVLILLKTYGLTGFCLEELKKTGGRAVVEDYEGGGGYDDVVLLSVEDDISAAFSAALSTGASPPVLRGETYLRWGGRDPAQVRRKELDFVRE